jgi:hypothetical protein
VGCSKQKDAHYLNYVKAISITHRKAVSTGAFKRLKNKCYCSSIHEVDWLHETVVGHLPFRRKSFSTKLVSLPFLALMVLAPAIPAHASFGDGTPTVPNPNVFSRQLGLSRVDGTSGAYTQQFSLDIPPGRNGLQPDLTLDYSSQRTIDGLVGYGWNLSIPYITRLNKTGSQNLYSSAAYFTSSIDGELATDATSTPGTRPSILDTLPLTIHAAASVTSDSFSYTVPSGGSNKLFVVMVCQNNATNAPTATLNGVSLATFVKMPGPLDRCGWYYSYLAAPSSGTFQINFTGGSTYADYEVMTLQDAAQANPDDTSAVNNAVATSVSVSGTTSAGNDLILSMGARTTDGFTTCGSGQTQISTLDDHTGLGYLAATWKAAGAFAATESSSGGAGDSVDTDWSELAIRPANGLAAVTNPNIIDSLPLTLQRVVNTTSGSFTYAVPSGGQNKLEVVMLCDNQGSTTPVPTASQNGVPLSTFVHIQGTIDRCTWYYAYLANPTSGLFQVNFANATYADYIVLTLQGAEQIVPDDTSAVTNAIASTATTSITTTTRNDFLLSMGARTTSVFTRYGTGQSEIVNFADTTGLGYIAATWKAAGTGPTSETTWGGATNNVDTDWAMVGFKPTSITSTTTTYRAKVDDGSFNAYSFTGNSWTVYDKKGTRYLYGSDDSGRMYDTTTGTSSKTYKWVLQEARDTNDNYIKYTYHRDGNELYPYQISYTGHGSSDVPFTITFGTSTRTDTRVNYNAGFVATTTYRISQITAAVNGTNVRQ